MNFRNELVVNYLESLLKEGYKFEFAREFERNIPTINKLINEETSKEMLDKIQKIVCARKEMLLTTEKSTKLAA